MGVLLDNLAKRGEATNCSSAAAPPTTAREFMKASYPMVKDVYPTGNDTFKPVDALGGMSGDASQQDKDDGTVDNVMVDATTFDAKVRELVTNAGGQYNFKAAAKAGLAKRIDPDLLATVQYLQKHSTLLNKAVRITNARLAKQGRPPLGSRSGSQSGSASGSASGSVSGNVSSMSGELSKVDRNVVIRALAGQIAERLQLMGRRVVEA